MNPPPRPGRMSAKNRQTQELALPRQPLAAMIASAIEERIARNAWREWLPSERLLAEALHVSRSTLRKAIAILQEKGVLRPEHPKGTRIVTRGAPPRKRGHSKAVGLLTPLAPLEMRPKVAVIVDKLREQLAEHGHRLHLFHGRHYFASGSSNWLARLVTSEPHDCWVLLQVPDKIKQWFYNNRIPSVIFGSCAPDAVLPSVDLDYYEICRHAVTKMVEAGHRHLAYIPDIVLDNTLTAGDVSSANGFRDGINGCMDPAISGKVAHLHYTTGKAVDILKHLLRGKTPPTALLVSNPYYFLLAHTYLQSIGLRVPRDISLVCRADDLFFDYINPPPTKYTYAEQAFSKPLLELILKVMDGRPIKEKILRIMPTYQAGGTLGPLLKTPPSQRA